MPNRLLGCTLWPAWRQRRPATGSTLPGLIFSKGSVWCILTVAPLPHTCCGKIPGLALRIAPPNKPLVSLLDTATSSTELTYGEASAGGRNYGRWPLIASHGLFRPRRAHGLCNRWDMSDSSLKSNTQWSLALILKSGASVRQEHSGVPRIIHPILHEIDHSPPVPAYPQGLYAPICTARAPEETRPIHCWRTRIRTVRAPRSPQ